MKSFFGAGRSNSLGEIRQSRTASTRRYPSTIESLTRSRPPQKSPVTASHEHSVKSRQPQGYVTMIGQLADVSEGVLDGIRFAIGHAYEAERRAWFLRGQSSRLSAAVSADTLEKETTKSQVPTDDSSQDTSHSDSSWSSTQGRCSCRSCGLGWSGHGRRYGFG